MASYFLDAQGNKTIDTNLGVTLVIDNPGTAQDSSEPIPTNGGLFRTNDGGFGLRLDGIYFEVTIQQLNKAGIDATSLPTFDWGKIQSQGMGLVKSGKSTDLSDADISQANPADKIDNSENVEFTTGAIENTPEAIAALRGVTVKEQSDEARALATSALTGAAGEEKLINPNFQGEPSGPTPATGGTQQPDPNNPFLGIPAEISSQFTTKEQAQAYWDNLGSPGGQGEISDPVTLHGGQFVEGQAYKNPDNAEIFLFKDGKFSHIQDEAAFREIFNGKDPQEGTNFTTLDSVEGLQFGPNITKENAQEFAGTGVPVGQDSPTTPGGGDFDFTPTGDERVDNMFREIDELLKELKDRGQILNPEIDITDEQAAEFLKIAEGEINPFFADQLALAREGFLRNAGFTQQGIVDFENRLEQRFGTAARRIGESAAEQGFAQSGLRQRDERELVQDTQDIINQNRRDLSFQVGGQARQFVQQFGFEQLPGLNIGAAPQVGIGGFGRSESESPFFNIDEDVFGDIIGEQEFRRRGAVRTRQSQLERGERSQQELDNLRKLTL